MPLEVGTITTPAELFYLTLLLTGGLYASMLAYYNGWLGSRRPNVEIHWNSEIFLWILLAMLVASAMFHLIGPKCFLLALEPGS